MISPLKTRETPVKTQTYLWRRPKYLNPQQIDSNWTLICSAFDIVVLMALQPYVMIAYLLPDESFKVSQFIGVVSFYCLIWILSASQWQLYKRYQNHFTRHDALKTFIAIAFSALALDGLLTLFNLPHPPVLLGIILMLVSFMLVVLNRVSFSAYARANDLQFNRRVAIIGVQALAAAALRKIKTQGHLRDVPITCVGFIAPKCQPVIQNDINILGNFAEIGQIIADNHLTDVVIAVEDRTCEKELTNMLQSLQNQPVYIYYVPSYLGTMLYRITQGQLNGTVEDMIANIKAREFDYSVDMVQIVDVRTPILTREQYIFKRAIDIMLASFLLILASPLMLTIALLIWLYDRGPIFFIQQRIGENGTHFNMLKFRSMQIDAEKKQNQINRYDSDGNLIHKYRDDPRITPIGRIIRPTSMDELPQLINILRGDMSLIGPRPELPWIVDQYQLWQLKRLSVPQGLTGWWQVNGRGDKPMHLNTTYDLYYVDNYSYKLDAIILFKTVGAVLRKTGAF